MKTLGIIIGTQDEPVSKKYYKTNKKMLQVLKEYDVSMDYIPYDFAIFAEVKNLEKKYKVEVIPLFGDDLTLESCNECDAIFTVYEGVYSFMDGGIDQYQEYMKILKKTTADVYPSQKMQEFIIDKHRYMRYLKRKGYDIAPTSFIDLEKYNLKTIMKFIEKNDYEKVAIKPELGAFKTGFKIIKNPNSKKIETVLKMLKKKKYKHLLLQPFLEEFNKYGEIKTYWVNGQNIYSYNQRWKDGEGVFQDQSDIDPDLLKQCLKVGEQVFKDLKEDHEYLIQCRIDFACCVNNDKHCRDFFINEIEICPTIGEQESDGKGYKILAEQIMKTCV